MRAWRRVVVAALAVVAIGGGAALHAGCKGNAYGTDESGDAAAAIDEGATDGAVSPCVPPTCNGTGGRCGKVSACGLEFSCGDCTQPNTCANGTCVCATGVTCDAVKAKCGRVDDGCGKVVECGGCDAGASCQRTAANELACAAGACVPEDINVSCDGFCKSKTNNCGEIAMCPDTCKNLQICGGGKAANVCGCPPAPVTLSQFDNISNGSHCYSEGTSCPPEFSTTSGSVAKLYATQHEGTTLLYRCKKAVSGTQLAFMLTTSPICESVAGFTLEGGVGFCATVAGLCGAIPLHRFVNQTTGDIVHDTKTVVPSYTLVGVVCHVLQ